MDDPDFADICAVAWRSVVSQIEGDVAFFDRFGVEFVRLMIAGDAFRKFNSRLGEVMSNRQWTWPLLERWEALFATEGVSPYMWDFEPPTHDRGGEKSAARSHGVAKVITHTAAMRAYADRHARKSTSFFAARALFKTDCPAENLVASRFEAAIAAGDLSVVPPFFPGDRTTLRYVRAGPLAT